MQKGWRAAALGAVAFTMTTVVGCSSASDDGATGASAARSSADAAASAAATAAPGTYGAPVDPSLPNPVDVATDTPAPTAPTVPNEMVPVVVTYSGWTDTSAAVEFGAYVAGMIESGGTCTLTLTAGSDTVSAEVPAEPDASSTTCPTLAIPGAELAPGPWQAVVSYESSSTSGQSDPVTVTVP